jgi:hypothetical protein
MCPKKNIAWQARKGRFLDMSHQNYLSLLFPCIYCVGVKYRLGPRREYEADSFAERRSAGIPIGVVAFQKNGVHVAGCNGKRLGLAHDLGVLHPGDAHSVGILPSGR